MGKPLTKPRESLYERDFYTWTQEQAAKLRSRAHNEIDWENAAEEIESLGRSDKREIRNRLGILLAHLLKWQFQAEKRKAGWLSTIREQRYQISNLIEESPSLKTYPGQELTQEFRFARLKAADETGLLEHEFPKVCPYAIGDVLNPEFLPGVPWSSDQLARD